jgi:glycine cleavage system aminomethyltransferase T
MCGKPGWIVSARWRRRTSSAAPRWKRAKAAGVKKTLVGLEMVERGIARDGYKVLDDGGREIGYVTSGSPAPFLKKNIALAYVPPGQFAAVGTAVKVEIRGQGVKRAGGTDSVL